MKANRGFKFDEDIDEFSSDNDDFNINYRNNNNFPKKPTRSVTIGDFFAPSLLTKKEEKKIIEEEELFEEEEFFEEEEEFYNEDFEDEEILENCFKTLHEKYEFSKNIEVNMIHSLRELDYNIEKFIKIALKGKFGTFKEKIKKVVKMNSNQPIRSVSVKNLKNLSNSIKTSKFSIEYIKNQLLLKKKHYNLVVVGHVDAGKSTLLGHILLLSGKISKSEMNKIEKDSKNLGKTQEQLAWIMSEDISERSHGVTIDVAMTYFETKDRQITLLDAPGHKDFVPNMIAGTSQADSAILVVDVVNPNIENGQAGEHLYLCRSLGVNNLIVVINKMDRVYYDENSFIEVQNHLIKFLKQLGWQAQIFIPTSALNSEDLLNPSKNMSWYKGETIFSIINSINPPVYDLDSKFLMNVSESIENGNQIIVVGKIDCGYICQSDEIKVYPANSICKVHSIKVHDQEVQFASSGYIAELTLNTKLPIESLMIGSVLSDISRPLYVSNLFIARVVTFNPTVPLLNGSLLVFHRHAVDVPLEIIQLLSILDKKTKETINKFPNFIPSHSHSEICFKLEIPLVIELHNISKTFGRFIIRAKGETFGFGSIINIIIYFFNNLNQIINHNNNQILSKSDISNLIPLIKSGENKNDNYRIPESFKNYMIDSNYNLIRPITYEIASKEEFLKLIKLFE